MIKAVLILSGMAIIICVLAIYFSPFHLKVRYLELYRESMNGKSPRRLGIQS